MKSLPFFTLLILPFLVIAQENDENAYKNLDENNLAIQGYDPISYFEAEKSMKGIEEYSYEFNGAIYHFSSEENLEQFKLNPSKYEPAYGGYCAYAMGKGYLAEVNPETFKIIDGKLLLFYNKLLVNTLNRWNKDEENLYPSAENNWEEKSAFDN